MSAWGNRSSSPLLTRIRDSATNSAPTITSEEQRGAKRRVERARSQDAGANTDASVCTAYVNCVKLQPSQRFASSGLASLVASLVVALTILPGKTFTATNEAVACSLFTQLDTVQLSGKKCHSPSAVGHALGAPGCAVVTLKIGDSSFSDEDLGRLVKFNSNTSLRSLDLSAKSLASLPSLACFASLRALDVSRNAGLLSVSELPATLEDLDVS